MAPEPRQAKFSISLPLPMDVAGTLMRLIGTAYPNARISNSTDGMDFEIPLSDRPRDIPEDFDVDSIDPDDSHLLSFGPEGLQISSPQDLTSLLLDVMKTSFAENPGAENYLETRCFDRENHEFYVMTFRRLHGKTPHEMRQKAEAERDALQAELNATKENLKSLLRSRKPVRVTTQEDLASQTVGSIMTSDAGLTFIKTADLFWLVTGTKSPHGAQSITLQEVLEAGPFTLLKAGE